MDVSLPIASVIPSLDGPVLAALAATSSPLRLTEINRMAGRGSVSGTRRVLLRLVATGLVDEVPGGFVLNREHVAAPAVEALAELHGRLLERIRDAIEQWGGEVALAGLFGSAARRDGDETSDIDVVILSDDDGLDDLRDDLAAVIRQWTGNEAHVMGVDSTELRRLRREGEPIIREWERDLVVICGERRALQSAT